MSKEVPPNLPKKTIRRGGRFFQSESVLLTKARSKRLIVNADDFGLTQGVNRGIIEGHRNGIVTSTSLMTNMPAFNQAVAMARENPRLAVGVHLTLINGRPIARPSDVSSLLDGQGFFFDNPFALLRRLIGGRVKHREIEIEVRAQIEKALGELGSISHLDGHKHLHIYPGILRPVLSVAKDYGIECIRYPVERTMGFGAIWRSSRSLQIVKQYGTSRAIAILCLLEKRKLDYNGFSTPDHCVGITHTGFLNKGTLREIIRSLPQGTTELICHPGYVSDELVKTPTRLRYEREHELDAITSPDIAELIRSETIQLISYRDLKDERSV